ncbi:MAG: methionine--tRNA ligase [Candidatus Acidiferrales bacterium]|jgi:methionyl-tRNA synthetase
MSKPKFYITTPIYYANSRPHVGSAYTTIVCDVIARYKRMCGYDVAYLTGTDEHGVNIERAAEKAGVTPQQLVDKNEKIFRDLWKLLGITTTGFIRTTEPRHALAVQNLVRRTMRLSPDAIYKRKYEGRYCIYDNLYVSDTPEPADCQICGRPGELVSEENYFFRLSAYQQKLLELYKNNPQFLYPDFRFNEVKSFVESGLKDISISRRSVKWGIPWPDDPEHVFYVWYDALTSYMSGIGFVDGEHDGAEFKKYWPADIHAMGKEIIRFHAVYWPAFLMAAEIELPKQIVAHGWLLFEQEKMSKSKGNVAYPEPIVKVLGNDALRYYLLRETVFGQDGNFSREALITRYNADLANGLGNLASRVLTMVANYCDGVIPAGRVVGEQLSENHRQFLGRFSDVSVKIILAAYEGFGFAGAIESIWALVAGADKYLVVEKPWTLASDPVRRDELERVLYVAAESIRFIAVLAFPVIPDATQRIWEQLGQTGRLADVRIDELKWGDLKPGTKIGKTEGVFPRVDKKEALERIETMENEIRNPGSTQPDASTTTTKKPPEGASTGTSAAGTAAIPAGAPGAGGAAGAPGTGAAATAATPAPAAPAKIGIEDFAKVELRVGVVKSAEKIAGADKLLKVMVDIGDEVRQVLAGIAPAYAPEELVGRKVVVVTNLAPRKMRGVESNGMLLAASAGPDGKAVLCTFAEDIPAGAKVK